MNLSPDKSHAYCTRQSCYVRLDQTEGQCRDDHNCSDAACPLEKEFGRPRFGRALEMMAAGIGSVIAKSG
ncbi:hypothetical protein [Aestuariivirga sp.]|uniref:hypothetical protein n=1 Tax=Aestuariivirga sp. TaxID=2650926 RepID=UPI0039198BE9